MHLSVVCVGIVVVAVVVLAFVVMGAGILSKYQSVVCVCEL